MSCLACNLALKSESFMICHSCGGKYHLECLNIREDQFKSFSKDYRSTWICPVCTNVTRRVRSNLNTPVRQHQVPNVEQSMDMSCEILDKSDSSSGLPTENIPINKFNELIHTLSVWRNEMSSDMNGIRGDIKEMKGSLFEIQAEIKTLRKEQVALKENVSIMQTEIKSLQASLQFQSEDHIALKKRVDDIARTSNDQTSSVATGLLTRIDSLEQQARQVNVEICNVPERRNENLMGIIEAIGTAIRFPISKGDIVSVHRVPHAQTSDKPKNIIAKFTTRILRDNVLAAYRKAKSLRSDQLGFQGSSSTIYLNEHLTLQRKHLFRKCREVARELQYKYVWVRNSTILVRKGDDSPALAIRGDNDIKRLKDGKQEGGGGK